MENFQQLMVQNPAMQWMWNSVFISLVTMFLVCATSSLAGYVLAKKRFYGQRILFAAFIAAMALPKQVVLVPIGTYRQLHGNSRYSLGSYLAFDWMAIGVFLMKQFSETSQQNCLNQLKIDGCGEIRTFWSVAFPIVKPGFAALAIFTFINTWNDYFMQLVMLTSRQKLDHLTRGCDHAGRNGNQLWFDHGRCSSCSRPIVTVFLVFQKILHQGITMGSGQS